MRKFVCMVRSATLLAARLALPKKMAHMQKNALSNIRLFHPDCDRWPPFFTESALAVCAAQGSRAFAFAGFLAKNPRRSITASEDFHLALKQNSMVLL